MSTTTYNTFSRAEEGFQGPLKMGGTAWVRTRGQKVRPQRFAPLGQTPYEHSVGFANTNCEDAADRNEIFPKSTAHVIVLPFLGGSNHEGCFPFTLRSLLRHLSVVAGTRSNAKIVTNTNNDARADSLRCMNDEQRALLAMDLVRLEGIGSGRNI